jgi:hypothetical protein
MAVGILLNISKHRNENETSVEFSKNAEFNFLTR